ncbi:MAG: right-handed parallel beta-helix repeat-containing protein [Tardiphaga sp.]
MSEEIVIDVGAPSDTTRPPSAMTLPTIESALSFVRGDIELRRMPATYRIRLGAEPILLDAPLTIAGLMPGPGGRVIIAGAEQGTRVSGGFRVDKYLKPISANAPFTYALPLADLPPDRQRGLLQTFATAPPRAVMIRANQSMVLKPTRWPQTGFVRIADIATSPKGDLAGLALAAPLPAAEASRGLWIGGYLTDSYLFVNAPIQSAYGQRVWLERTRLRADGQPPERVFLSNLPSFVQCNAFFYDPARRTLNFCSDRPIETLEIATLDRLLDVSNSDNLTVTRLIFEMSTGSGVTVRNSSRVDITNAAVQLVAGNGISYAAASNSTVSQVTVRSVGGRAVALSGGDRPTLAPGVLTLEYSVLQDFSQITRTYAPAVDVAGVGVAVRQNLIFNGPQSAVMFSGNDHVFEDNLMVQLATEAGDSGFFYTGRDFTAQGNVIRRNVLVGTAGQSMPDPRGIYLDEFSSGNLVADNVVIGLPYGILMNGGKDNRLLSNIFVLSTPSIWASALGTAAWWQPWRNDHMRVPDGLSVKNLYSLPIDREPWTTRYPQLATYRESDLLKPERNIIEANIFLGGGAITALDQSIETATLRDNRAVVYQGSLQLLERLRNRIRRDDIPATLKQLAGELDRHGIAHIPLQIPDVAGTFLPLMPLQNGSDLP